MSVADEIARIKGNIASAYTAAGGKGATLPAVQNSANLAGCIDTITGGGGEVPAEEWQPNPNWWDIRKILDEDTRDYKGKVGVILYNFNDVSDFQLSSSGMTAVATSDGAFYSYANNGSAVSHNWDTSKDKDDGRGFKTRWVIYYYTTDTTTDLFRQDDTKFGWAYNPIAYLVLKINCSKATNFAYGQKRLEGICNDGYVIKGTSFKNFLYVCYILQKLPDNINTSESTDFDYFCYLCHNLSYLPDNLDTSKGTTFKYFLNNCFKIQKLPDNLDTSNGIYFNYFLAECTSLKALPEGLNTSKGTDFSYFLSGCDSLLWLPDGLDTSNGIYFSYFLSGCLDLQKLPDGLNTSAGKYFGDFLEYCNSLVTLPDGLDTSNATNFSGFCKNCVSLQKTPEITMAENTVNITSKYSSPFNGSSWIVEVPLTLPSNTNFWLDSSTRISIESFRYIADNAPDVTATPRTLTVGSTNISRINAADPTIITDLNAKGWTVK